MNLCLVAVFFFVLKLVVRECGLLGENRQTDNEFPSFSLVSSGNQ